MASRPLTALRASLVLAALLGLAAAGVAQGTPLTPTGVLPVRPPVNLYGLADGGVAPLVRQDPVSCAQMACATPLGAAAGFGAGGTAFDATRGALWISSGSQIACVTPPGNAIQGCNVLVPAGPLSGPAGANTMVTGLAVNEARRVLVAVSRGRLIAQYRLTLPLSVPFTNCAPPIAQDQFIGGVATDDLEDRVIYSVSTTAAPAGRPINEIRIAPRTNPCNAVCVPLPVATCSGAALGVITGLTYDACNRHLWVTDGARILGLSMSRGRCPTLTEIRCCTTNGRRLLGLAVSPPQSRSLGRSCVASICGSCTDLTHTLRGDPLLGNGQFGLIVRGAPLNAPAVLMLNAGVCQSPGAFVQGICGSLRVSFFTPPLLLNTLTRGVAPCSGGVAVDLPIPPQRSLCGAILSTQFAGFCIPVPGTVGSWATNCVTWQIGA